MRSRVDKFLYVGYNRATWGLPTGHAFTLSYANNVLTIKTTSNMAYSQS